MLKDVMLRAAGRSWPLLHHSILQPAARGLSTSKRVTPQATVMSWTMVDGCMNQAAVRKWTMAVGCMKQAAVRSWTTIEDVTPQAVVSRMTIEGSMALAAVKRWLMKGSRRAT